MTRHSNDTSTHAFGFGSDADQHVGPPVRRLLHRSTPKSNTLNRWEFSVQRIKAWRLVQGGVAGSAGLPRNALRD